MKCSLRNSESKNCQYLLILNIILPKGLDMNKNLAGGLNERRLARIIDTLYLAIVNSRGLYRTITGETHAPQRIYYPGSPAVRPKAAVVSPQSHLFNERSHSVELPKHEEVATKPLVVLMPETLEHRQWLWFTTLTDRREDSMQVYKAHCHIYRDFPHYYTSEVLDVPVEVFRESLKRKYKIGSPGQSVEYWRVCANTLFTRFGGDPVNLLRHAGWSVELVYAWKHAQKKPVEKGGIGYDPIPGWGRKLLSLYFLYLSELGYPLPDDVFASDVHAQAIVLQTGCFDYGGNQTISSAALAEMIRKFISRYCKEKRYDIVIVAHASWLLGSNLCDQCSRRRDAPVLCPIYKECKGRIDTSHYWAKGQWPKGLPIMNKGGELPPFGVPTDVTPRLSQRRRVVEQPINLHLFGKK